MGAGRAGAERTAARALRHPGLRWYLAEGFFGAASMTCLRAAVAWQVFELTGSAFQLGVIGVVQFLPVIPIGLVGGAVADRVDRRRILLVTHTVVIACVLGLAIASARGAASLPLVYALVLATAVATSAKNPARSAMLPALVPLADFPAATTVTSSARNIARGLGPVLLGGAVALHGIALGYAVNAVLSSLALACLAGVPARPLAGDARSVVSFGAIREGIAFVWSRPVILGAMSLDMFAVFFASVTALMPVFARDILHVGPVGYGLLNGAVELGMALMSLALLVLPPIQRAGRALLLAIAVFGAATVIFGLSRSFPLSLAAMVAAGMADQISVVSRQIIVQLSTPDALRGRVSSVNLVFIGASNQLGAAESGFLAALSSATFSVVAGGVACLGILAWVAWRTPALRRYEPPPSAP